ncbi:uncharacterized protein ACNLHF_028252 isoform 3-T3 [Anomaloglossus baeobatrachus]|uniref:uncharacterized protein LOC142249544 isoform X2 n=1 Tax=Anomaloglossus baeobatrachus TaxID=238106 RepID=UPI003F4F9EBD
MKIIVFLVLAGVSLAAAGERFPCFIATLQSTPGLKEKCLTFICNYRGNNFDGSAQNYNDALKALKGTTANGACSVEQILGTDGALVDISASATEVGAQAISAGAKLTDALGLSDAGTDVLCKLNLTPQTISALDDLLCKNDYKALSANMLFTLLKQVACFGDDAAGTRGALENVVASLGDAAVPLLQNVVATVIGLLQELFPGGMPGLGCDLMNIFSGGVGGLAGGVGGLTGGATGIVGGLAGGAGGVAGGVGGLAEGVGGLAGVVGDLLGGATGGAGSVLGGGLGGGLSGSVGAGGIASGAGAGSVGTGSGGGGSGGSLKNLAIKI